MSLTLLPPRTPLPTEPFSFLVVMTERHPFLGKIVTGRIHSGSVAVGDKLKVLWKDGERQLNLRLLPSSGTVGAGRQAGSGGGRQAQGAVEGR